MENNENQNSTKELANKNSSEFSLFDPLFDGFFRLPSFRDEVREMEKLMKTDVHETDDNYEIEMELPGFKKSDIDIELKNGYLTVSAQRNTEQEKTKKHKPIRKERFYGNLVRSFYVGDLKREEVMATLTDGVLYISFPKEQKRDNLQRIEIK